MSVLSESRKTVVTYDDGTSTYAIGFVFLRNSDVIVRLETDGPDTPELVLTEGFHYDISGSNIEFLTTFTTGGALTIERTVPFTQTINFVNQGSFSPSIHEDALDDQTFMAQQLNDRLTAVEVGGAVEETIAGSGLSYSGSTLNVGAGDGILVDADSVSVDFSNSAPADVTRAAASAGNALKAARANHKHDISTAAPAAGSVAIGNSSSAGSASSLAKSDHVHPVATGSPVNVTAAAASDGAATSFSRSDHKHDVTVGTPATLTDSTNATGSATSLVRSDHTHSHGNRGGGSLHAVAVANGNAGFLSGADKAKLDALVELNYASTQTTTTDNSATEALQWSVTNGSSETAQVFVSAWNANDGQGASYVRTVGLKRTGGTTAIVGSVATTFTAEDNSAMECTVTISGNKPTVVITGLTSKTIYWNIRVERVVAHA